jgi:hypothetical protein
MLKFGCLPRMRRRLRSSSHRTLPNGGQECITSFGSTHRTARLWASSTMGDAPRRIFVCGLTAASRFHADSGARTAAVSAVFATGCAFFRFGRRREAVSRKVHRQPIAGCSQHGSEYMPREVSVGTNLFAKLIQPHVRCLKGFIENVQPGRAHWVLLACQRLNANLYGGATVPAQVQLAVLARSWNSLSPSPIKWPCVPSR